jgi:enoyl-[acyl-carrier protein] reductase III
LTDTRVAARPQSSRWALILGASSGFGAATALELARAGMNVFGVHLDRRSTMPNVERGIRGIEALGRRAIYFNVNAADAQRRQEVLDRVAQVLAEEGDAAGIRVFLHSIAFGSLRPFVGSGPADSTTQAQMEMTLDTMANCLVYWVQDLYWRGLLTRGARIFAMTSAGSNHAIEGYGAVSAAKAALDAHVRQLAFELAPRGISANSIRAGVTDTPALRKIPGHEKLVEHGLTRNPSGRMTTPEDVARAIAALCDERAYWITGNVIGVDGGEDIVV